MVNPYLSSGLFHPYILDEFIFNFGGDWCTFSFLSAESDLGLHCLPRSQKMGWVKYNV